MNALMNFLKKSWLFILALLFLSSCYDIVYVSQDKDVLANQEIQPTICVHVSNYYNYNTPYFGVLLPDGWYIESGFDYVQEFNGYSMKLGEVHFSRALSSEMESIDPAPDGYHWWVGFGNNKIKTNGVICTTPIIKTGNSTGEFVLDYMIGDNYNGLNFLRSRDNSMLVIDKWTPKQLTAKLNGQSIEVQWEKPLAFHGIKGYNIYRNGIQLNENTFLAREYIDTKPATNSYEYVVNAVYFNGTQSELSASSKVCYCPSGPSIEFDGNDNSVMVFDGPSLNPTTRLTLESWIRFKHGGLQQPCIISKSGAVNCFELFTTNASAHRFVIFRITPGYLVSNTQLDADIWYHVAATYDGKMMRLYINGKLDSEKPASGCLSVSEEPLLIGKRNANSNDRFKGNIDEVRIWNVVRTGEQIEKYQRLLLDDDAEGLIGYWRMDDGCNYYTCDMSGEGNDAYLMGSCWSPSTFPFVPDFNESVASITVPVINHYFPDDPLTSMTLIYKFNPDLLVFEGLDIYETQIKKWNIKTYCSTSGYLKIVATSNGTLIKTTDVLIKLKFHALQPTLVDVLDFLMAEFNDVPIRTMSGKVTVANNTGSNLVSNELKNMSAKQDVFVTMYPNPVKTNTTFTYELEENAYVELAIFNLTGQRVSTVISENQYAGDQRAEFDASKLAPGVYMYILQANNSKFTGKMIVHE